MKKIRVFTVVFFLPWIDVSTGGWVGMKKNRQIDVSRGKLSTLNCKYTGTISQGKLKPYFAGSASPFL